MTKGNRELNSIKTSQKGNRRKSLLPKKGNIDISKSAKKFIKKRQSTFIQPSSSKNHVQALKSQAG